MTKLYFEPFPKQQQFIEAVFNPQYRIIGYGGAMGGGKTYVALATLILLHKLYPKSRSIVVRDNMPRLKETTVISFRKVCPPNFIADYNQTSQKITFKNQSEMIFMGEDIAHDPDLDKFKGLEINFAFLEQMEELSSKTLDMMMMRVGRHRLDKMPDAKILYTLNPSNTWVREYCYERDKKGTLPHDHKYIRATIAENPILYNDANYMKGLENMDSMTRLRYVEGDWDAFKGKNPFAYAFNETKHTAENLEMDWNLPLYLSFDFNHSPSVCTIWQHDENKIRCLYELESNQGLTLLCDRIKQTLADRPNWNEISFVTGDRSGWSKSALVDASRTAYDIIQNELNLTPYQIKTPQSNPAIMKSRELCNSILEKHKDFLIDRTHCPNLIFDLKFVESDDEHDIVKDRNKQEGKADYLDCYRYYKNTFHSDFIRL